MFFDENGNITDETKEAIGCSRVSDDSIIEYEKDLLNLLSMETSCRMVGSRKYYDEKGIRDYGNAFENWGNSFSDAARANAVLRVISNVGAEKCYDFFLSWVGSMAELKSFKYNYDDRNEKSVEVCFKIYNEIANSFGNDPVYLHHMDERMKEIIPRIHRTVQQFLTKAFLKGLYVTSCELGKGNIKDIFKRYYSCEDDVKMLKEISFPCI